MRVVQVVEGFGQFTVQEIDAPKFCKDGAIMQMEAALVTSYMAALPSGAWMTPLRPFITGQCAVGVVEQSSGIIQQEQRVYFDAYTGSNDQVHPVADHGFLGCFVAGPGTQADLATWPNGSFANLIRVPNACFTPIPDRIDAVPEVLCRLGWFGAAMPRLPSWVLPNSQYVSTHPC